MHLKNQGNNSHKGIIDYKNEVYIKTLSIGWYKKKNIVLFKALFVKQIVNKKYYW